MYKRFVAAVALGVCVLLLGGCAAAPESPYKQEFVAAEKANKDNPFVRQVFADALSTGVIKAADYNESVKRLQKCYEDKGLTVYPQSDDYGLGLKTFGFAADEMDQDGEAAMDACNEEFDGVIGYTISDLYFQQVTNPQKQDKDQLIADCYVRKGIAPKGFDAQDYRELKDKRGAKCTNGKCVLPNGSEVDADKLTADMFDLTIPGGKNTNELDRSACEFAPLKE